MVHAAMQWARMLFYSVLATSRSMIRVSRGWMLLVPVTLSWMTPHSHWGCVHLLPVAASTVAEVTGTWRRYALDATMIGGHAVHAEEVAGGQLCTGTEGVPIKATKVETPRMAKENIDPKKVIHILHS